MVEPDDAGRAVCNEAGRQVLVVQSTTSDKERVLRGRVDARRRTRHGGNNMSVVLRCYSGRMQPLWRAIFDLWNEIQTQAGDMDSESACVVACFERSGRG